ncbi:vWA domain-containing protein [Mariprofundus erugo]|uniref:vWA domain-containing protein n=1 Tax=Mariprofundus erugo TaxID=2528639 RepID=UPI001386EEF4|nr:VWA domain-containing protein [Mariprofundus erugo]
MESRMQSRIRHMILLASLLLPMTAFAAKPAVLFVFDGSGSMWGQVEGKTKIDLAREAMSGLLKDFPDNTDIGLVAYGHNREGDCGDIELLAPLGSSRADVTKAVTSIQPKGKTPLTKSIQFAAEQLKNRDAPTAIVVVSDGKESCNADPCAAASAITASGVNLKVHVIGFDVKKDEAEQLQCIAKNGGGKYFSAGNASELTRSFAEVKKEVVEARPVLEKKEPVSTVLFHDDFDGDALAGQWEVRNPNQDTMIVEDGLLQIITEVPANGLFDPNNFVTYHTDLPKNYEVDARVLLTQMEGECEYWTNAPMVGLLLFQDAKNGISLVAGHSTNRCGSSADAVTFSKLKNGEWQPGFSANVGGSKEDRVVQLRLRRSDRKFSAFYSVDGSKWVKLGEFAGLRSPYTRIGLIGLKGGKETHESVEKVDWFEIRKLSDQ